MDLSTATRLRERLRRPGDALAAAPIGTVPILWNNVDVPDLRLGAPPELILDEIARIGYEGTQLGLGFPEGSDLRLELQTRGLRLAEVYAGMPMTADGPTDDARAAVQARLHLLDTGGGDVLCLALDPTRDRTAVAGRARDTGAPSLTERGWHGLAELLHEVAAEGRRLGHRAVFHPHAGSYVETPAEVDRLLADTDPDLLGLCLDVGHYLVGGGDPIAGLRAFGARVWHVHLKDVDPDVLDRLRAGEIASFADAIKLRLFTELGSGVLDIEGVLGCLSELRYEGWLMVEQDSAWGPPSEAAAIGRRVLQSALRRLGQERAA